MTSLPVGYKKAKYSVLQKTFQMLSASEAILMTRKTPFLHKRSERGYVPISQWDTLVVPPNGEHPKAFMKRISAASELGDNLSESLIKAHGSGPIVRRFHPNHGTTTVAFCFRGGILLAVDSRSTQGQFVSSGVVQKVIEITPHILGTIAGVAGDCQFWERDLGRKCRLYELENGERIYASSASKLFISTLHSQSGTDMSVGAMISGFDSTNHPCIYYCDSEGTRIGGYLYGAGSGSTFAFGIVDTEYDFEMTEEQAIALGKKAIYHAVSRDAMSGGMLNIYVIRPSGWEHVLAMDNYEYYRTMHPDAPELPPPPQ